MVTARCVHVEDQWVSPSDFESSVGKVKSRNWKKSIAIKGVLISSFLSGLGQSHDSVQVGNQKAQMIVNRRSKLKGSRIFINADLPKEERLPLAPLRSM